MRVRCFIWKISEKERYELRTKMGVLFQDGALFGSMNIFDNTCFPLRKHTDKSEDEIRDIVTKRLNEVGLDKAHTKLPSEVSGGMRHYGVADEAFEHEDPFVRQFLAGESAGPLGMD